MVTKGQNGIEVAHLLVDHEAKDAHLSGAAIVELDAALGSLPFLAFLVPAKVEEGLLLAVEVDLGSVAEITGELGLVSVNLGGVAVDHLHGRPGEEHLDPNLKREGAPCVETGGDVLGSGEADAGGGGEVSNDGEHGNATVLQISMLHKRNIEVRRELRNRLCKNKVEHDFRTRMKAACNTSVQR